MYGQTPLDFAFMLLSALTALVLAAAFLDFAAGIAVCATGHCHPDVVADLILAVTSPPPSG